MSVNKVCTVLLVDDDANVVAVIEQALTQIGCVVLSAANGHDALARHEHCCHAIDLLITDLQMPHMNGRELAQRLLISRPDLPIVFISGDPEAEILAGSAFPKHLLMQKPFMPSELVARAMSLLNS